MTSPHFIAQYFTSFCEDPILLSLEQEVEEEGEEKEGYSAARMALKMEQYEQVVNDIWFITVVQSQHGEGLSQDAPSQSYMNWSCPVLYELVLPSLV